MGFRIGINISMSGAGGGGVFTPLGAGNLVAAYEADTLALTNLDPVASFTDLSGNGRHLTQATAGKRPLYKTAQMNGLPVVEFDGVDDILGPTAFSFVQPCHYYIVCKVLSSPIGVAIQSTLFDGNTGGSDILYSTSLLAPLAMYAGGSVITGNGAGNVARVWSAYFNNASSRIIAKGQSAVTGVAGAQNPGGLTMGSRAGETQQGNVQIAALYVYNADKTAQETDFFTYFGTKYGV